MAEYELTAPAEYWAKAIPGGYEILVARRWGPGGINYSEQRAAVVDWSADDVLALLRGLPGRVRTTDEGAPRG